MINFASLARYSKFSGIIVIFALCLSLVLPAALAKGEDRATIRVSGAWALYPMMVRWGEEYQKIHPNIRIEISAGGAGKGAADVLGGLADIGMISRDIHPEEIKNGGFWVAVVKDAVLPMINAFNPVIKPISRQGAKRDTLIALWIQNKPLTWGEVAGAPEITKKVHVYTRSDACGAAETWAQYLGKRQEDLQGVAVYGDPGLAEAVKRDPLGIGYNNLNYAYDAKTGKPVAGLKILPLDINGNGKLDPAENFYQSKAKIQEAIANGRYPSPPARDLNLLTKGKPTGATAAFMRWILTDGQRYVDEAGYIALPPAKLKGNLKKLK
jgi:phosphate transport system substrate-binding protein